MDQRLTRRAFTVTAAGALVSLTVLGCTKEESAPTADGAAPAGEDKASKKKKKPAVPAAPFLVGALEQYRTVGIHPQYNDPQRVWLVSDGARLIALLDVCTHSSCGLLWDEEQKNLKCPCHLSHFDLAGQPLKGSKADEPLDRLALSIQDGQVQVDPTIRFNSTEWDKPGAALPLG